MYGTATTRARNAKESLGRFASIRRSAPRASWRYAHVTGTSKTRRTPMQGSISAATASQNDEQEEPLERISGTIAILVVLLRVVMPYGHQSGARCAIGWGFMVSHSVGSQRHGRIAQRWRVPSNSLPCAGTSPYRPHPITSSWQPTVLSTLATQMDGGVRISDAVRSSMEPDDHREDGCSI